MNSDFTGFNFLPSSMHPVADIRRGYGTGSLTMSDSSMSGNVNAAGAAVTVDKTGGNGVNIFHSMLRLDF